MTSKINALILVLTLTCGLSHSARILGIFPAPLRSHFSVFERLMHGLAARGHQVDVVSHFPQTKTVPGYNDISIHGSIPIVAGNASLAKLQSFSTPWTCAQMLWHVRSLDLCRTLLANPEVQALKNTTVKYDVIINELFATDCFLGFSHIFNAPIIGISSSQSFPWSNDRFGYDDNPAYVPNIFLPYSHKMNLKQRVVNSLVSLATKLGYYFYTYDEINRLSRRFFGPDVPTTDQMAYRMSLFFVNSHYSIQQARSAPPNVIEIGGIHIREAKNLSETRKRILNGAHPVVLMSFGSIIKVGSFPADKKGAFLDGFAELPYTVILKARKDEFEEPHPANVVFDEWVPQLELLCHPNVKAFITHGGLLGTQESVYCGVPMIGMPFFSDQYMNIEQYVQQNIAVKLPYEELTKERLLDSVNKVINDQSIQTSIAKLSHLFRDRPMSALDTAIFWTEYVIRNEGAQHLRPESTFLTWYQRALLDVISIIVLCACTLTYLVYVTFKCTCRLYLKCTGMRKTKTQ